MFFKKLPIKLNLLLISKYSTKLNLPPCEYTPSPYTGLSFNKIKEIRSKNLNPCLFTLYKNPVMITNGYKQWLYDVNGKRYLDLFGGIVTVSVGHCHPYVTEAAKKQMTELWHTTNIYLHPKIHEYAEKLAAKMPGNLKVAYFVNSGSEANDLAILMARMHTKNNEVISLRNGYHGMSLQTMTLGASSMYKYNVSYAPGVHHVMNPDVFRGIWGGKYCRDSPVQTLRNCSCTDASECQASDNYFEQFQEVFKYSLPKKHVAAFIAESIQGVGGTVQFPKGFLKRAVDLVRENGGVYIADEVQTGFGRTGEHYWGFQMHNVQPDIVTMAKGIGNGFPMGAVLTTPEVAASLTMAVHFNTFGGNPVASAVGSAVLDVIDNEQLQQHCDQLGTYFLNELATLRDEFDIVGDVRGKGLMIGVELVNNKTDLKPLDSNQFSEIFETIREHHILIGKGGLYGNVLRIKPPMCITKMDVDYTLKVLKHAFQQQS